MGIKGLNQIIADNAPGAIVKGEIKQFFGRKVAIDASMSLYQFLIAVRQGGQQLTSDSGETTSHLVGLFNRTIRMVDNGIKPLYIFDGKPPKLKSGELAKRGERKADALKSAAEAKEAGKMDEWERFERRTVRVTREQNDEAKKLLELMGIPLLVAPCEAEAQCAELARSGKVYAAASEDMDTLCFAAPVLLRHLTFSEQRKLPITEYNLEKTLEGLEMDMPRFVDLCILLGCDYVEPIRGIGPVSALKLIKTYHDLDGVVKHFQENPDGKIKIPDTWAYKDARELFLKPSIADASNIDFKWDQPNVEGLIEFLVKEKGFSEDRVRSAAERLSKALAVKPQGRLEGFFKVKPKDMESPAKRKGTSSTKKENVKNSKNKKVKSKQ